MAIIKYYYREGVVTFKEPKKCPKCNCYFFTNYDLECHMKTHEKPLGNRSGEWIDARDAPDIAKRIAVSGEYVEGPYKYTIVDGKILKKRIYE